MKYNLKILIIFGLIPLVINIANITTDTSGVNIVLTGLNIVILFSLLMLIRDFTKDTNMKNTKFYKSFYIFILCIFIQ